MASIPPKHLLTDLRKGEKGEGLRTNFRYKYENESSFSIMKEIIVCFVKNVKHLPAHFLKAGLGESDNETF